MLEEDSVMQPKNLVVMNYFNFCIIGPVLCPLSFVSGPGRSFEALPPGKYLVGAAWAFHGFLDIFHHPNICCSTCPEGQVWTRCLPPAVLLGATWVFVLRCPLRPYDRLLGP